MKPIIFAHCLLQEPQVWALRSGVTLIPGINYVLSRVGRGAASIFILPAWYLIDEADFILSAIKDARRQSDKLSFFVLAPTEEISLNLRRRGIEAVHIHSNAFLNEKALRPNHEPKLYSAVHVAGAEEFKRHHLAYEVSNIAVVSYFWRQDPRGLATLLGYKHASYRNFNIQNRSLVFNHLSTEQVASVVSRSSCGLILSEKEGQNRASTEYLLCGIPVLTTPSVGGREEFYDQRHVFFVEPDPRKIAEKVHEVTTLPFDSQEIRGSVLEKVLEHRRRFLNLLSSLTGHDFWAEADKDNWIPRWNYQLKERVHID